MGYNVTIQTRSDNKTDKLTSNHFIIENDNKDKALASLKKGQTITGEVVSTGDQVTIGS
jgi:hypothetical protein